MQSQPLSYYLQKEKQSGGASYTESHPTPHGAAALSLLLLLSWSMQDSVLGAALCVGRAPCPHREAHSAADCRGGTRGKL